MYSNDNDFLIKFNSEKITYDYNTSRLSNIDEYTEYLKDFNISLTNGYKNFYKPIDDLFDILTKEDESFYQWNIVCNKISPPINYWCKEKSLHLRESINKYLNKKINKKELIEIFEDIKKINYWYFETILMMRMEDVIDSIIKKI